MSTAPTPTSELRDIATLRERLARVAGERELLDVAYRRLDSPIGSLIIAATPRGVVRLAFENEPVDEVLEELAAKLSPRVLEAPVRLDEVARELDEYFAGARTRFDVAVDFALSSGFRRHVLDYLVRIPYGLTESYAEVAIATDNPKAVRAVGSACATNPIPLIVPCHRVLRSDGSLGGYRGGLAAKRVLLALEAAA